MPSKKWVVVDSYGAIVHRDFSLTNCGVWIDPVLGIDFTRKAWGKNKRGEGVDDDRFEKQSDGSYIVKMYRGQAGMGGELTIRKVTPEDG